MRCSGRSQEKTRQVVRRDCGGPLLFPGLQCNGPDELSNSKGSPPRPPHPSSCSRFNWKKHLANSRRLDIISVAVGSLLIDPPPASMFSFLFVLKLPTDPRLVLHNGSGILGLALFLPWVTFKCYESYYQGAGCPTLGRPKANDSG